ncbi:MAG: hypothetical protein JRJ03_04610 [Deltaproteobacteria bacterium]|nr:hypothetical protein [Deltaproteobacteria bacterium]
MGRRQLMALTVFAFGLITFFLFGPDEAFGQFGLGQQQLQQQAEGGVLSSAGGRYVFGQISDSSRDQFMLDTLTGRLWRIAKSGEIGLFLRAIPYKTEKGDYSPFPDPLTKPKKKEGIKQ